MVSTGCHSAVTKFLLHFAPHVDVAAQTVVNFSLNVSKLRRQRIRIVPQSSEDKLLRER